MRVGVFVGTRADLGPLESVIAALDSSPDITVDVIGGVAFSVSDLETRLRPEGFRGGIVALAPPLSSVTATSMLEQGARLTDGARKLLHEDSYDALVLLGDRWELLYIAPAALLSGIRIVHIHGGEVTEGAIDERVRHAVTKLADMHCAASEDAAARIRQMGESDERIRVTGAPGLDRISSAIPYDDDQLSEVLGRPVSRPLGLFTYHPPTAAEHAPLAEWTRDALAGALDVCDTLIVTDPGVDEGRQVILDIIDEAAAHDARIIRVPGLGQHYPPVLAASDVVIGNSSSGVIEAASAGVPAVDIGTRQKGRLRADSVTHAEGSRASVAAAVREALRTSRGSSDIVNPYGNGGAAARITAAIKEVVGLPYAKGFQECRGRDEH